MTRIDYEIISFVVNCLIFAYIKSKCSHFCKVRGMNNRAEGARAPQLFCSNNVSNKRSERNVKKKKNKREMRLKGMRGRENDQNIRRAP